MKKILFIFLMVFLITIVPVLYFLDKEYFPCPIDYEGDIIIREDSFGKGYFGARRRGGRRHAGIDLYALVGTELKALSFGRVVETGSRKLLGKYVELAHPGNLVSIYGHLSEIAVKSGQWVSQGTIIGYVGKTGNANHPQIQPHVHLETRIDDKPVDPQTFFKYSR